MADDDEGDSLSSYSISLPTITAAIGIHGISYDTVASRVVHHDDRATKNGPTPVDSAGMMYDIGAARYIRALAKGKQRSFVYERGL